MAGLTEKANRRAGLARDGGDYRERRVFTLQNRALFDVRLEITEIAICRQFC